MLQRTGPTVSGTRVWDGSHDPDLTEWLGPRTHHYDGVQLVIASIDGPVRPLPGYHLVRWTDGAVTTASPRTAERVYGPDGLCGQLARARAAVEAVHALFSRWVKAGPPPLGRSLSRWWDARLIELRAALDKHKEH
ncbi:hypothetical protein [Streptomyces scabiei]|uniref:hypothetical protein n=1 Tax=Streptomyces scabiei TaxID=1930 RepID=UPI0029BA473F|nr:hypothetical protein [Streptomyces scabiei]MDX3202108.1 hypothetical protein [Streptomyces scabiei]MDX3217721.1 hypothetical protein [Streptomyces scabiei]